MSGIFENGRDDFMFPTTFEGMKQAGMVLESACNGGCDPMPEGETDTVNKDDVKVDRAGDVQVTESCGKDCKDKDDDKENVFEAAMSEMAEQNIRSRAMSAVLGWLEEGDYTYDALNDYVAGACDYDDDMEIGESEEEYFNEIWAVVPDALKVLGAKGSDVDALYEGPGEEANNAAVRIGVDVSDKMNSQKTSDIDIITGFAVAGGSDEVLESIGEGTNDLMGVFESNYLKEMAKTNRFAVRGNKKVKIKKHKYTRLTGERKRKAIHSLERYGHTAQANRRRERSMNKRKALGL